MTDALDAGQPLDAIAPIFDALHGACADNEHQRAARLAQLGAECRRQARDAALALDFSVSVGDPNMIVGAPMPGCLLIQPPMVGMDARAVRLEAESAKVPLIVLAREPLMRDGRWPIVASGSGVRWPDERRGPPGGATVRARIQPPVPVTRVDSSPTRDEAPTPPPAWFAKAIGALDDAAMSLIDDEAPAAHRARHIVELIDAHGTGSVLFDAMQEASMQALCEPDPGPREIKRSTSF